ncbi:MAG: hypothetical protein KAG43_10745, partial [Candidatus Marithrix sp.]|nr:hypothetical protein [Candidatus Marithrix sp.]
MNILKIFLGSFIIIFSSVSIVTADNVLITTGQEIKLYYPLLPDTPLRRREAGFVNSKSGNVSRGVRGVRG